MQARSIPVEENASGVLKKIDPALLRHCNKNAKFLPYFIRFTAGLITIFTSKSLRNETISKTKKAMKKDKRRNKPR